MKPPCLKLQKIDRYHNWLLGKDVQTTGVSDAITCYCREVKITL